MKQNKYRSAASLWSRPDPVLAQAGLAGEFLVAKVRLSLATLLLLIPLIDSFFFPADPKESLVGLSLCAATFTLSAAVYNLLRREFNPAWLNFATASLDVSFVSAALGFFLVLNEPHTAVNSKVVFEGYFLAIASTSLRYDKRVCITAGLLAFLQYFALVDYAATHWRLNDPQYAPYRYGLFSWGTEISRLIMMLAASALSIVLVSRSQRLLYLATCDPLTGLFNRGYVDDRLAVEMSRARRSSSHSRLSTRTASNRSMTHTATRPATWYCASSPQFFATRFVRATPSAATVEKNSSLFFRKSICVRESKNSNRGQLVAGTPITLGARGGKVHVTISAGLASFPDDSVDPDELFALADQRMFQAKAEGRNRVVASPTPVPIQTTAADPIPTLHS